MSDAPASRSQPSTETSRHTPTPWELIEATEHHGAYIVNSWGRTICDLYAMSNPMAASVRNGGTSFPVHFDDMAANAAFIVEAVNSHATLTARVAELEANERAYEAVLGPFAQTGWMTDEIEHTARTVVAHMHPEREREIILSSEDFKRARDLLAAIQTGGAKG